MAMGQPPVAPLANLLLASYELECNGTEHCEQSLRRLIDDVAWIEGNINTIYPEYIKFNRSTLSEDKFLTFLDTEVSTERYEVRMHYKDHHRPFTEWKSNVPRAFIANTITTECLRAKRICTTANNYEVAIMYLRQRAAEANIPQNVIDSKVSSVVWTPDTATIHLSSVQTAPQAERYYSQLEKHKAKWTDRQTKAKQRLMEGTVVAVQRVYTGMDLNTVTAMKSRLHQVEDIITRGIVMGVDDNTAHTIGEQLSNIRLMRARKPTPSVKVIARKVLNTYIATGRLAARLDGMGGQWTHGAVNVKGMTKEMLEGRAFGACHSLSHLVTPPFKAEEGCNKTQPKDLPSKDNGEGERNGKRRRRTKLV
jgi:hypothetical protein